MWVDSRHKAPKDPATRLDDKLSSQPTREAPEPLDPLLAVRTVQLRAATVREGRQFEQNGLRRGKHCNMFINMFLLDTVGSRCAATRGLMCTLGAAVLDLRLRENVMRLP